jgi:hypothetical protein
MCPQEGSKYTEAGRDICMYGEADLMGISSKQASALQTSVYSAAKSFYFKHRDYAGCRPAHLNAVSELTYTTGG